MLEFTLRLAPVKEVLLMLRIAVKTLILAVFILTTVSGIYSQSPTAPKYKTQELSEKEGVPVLMTHLPDWENRRSATVFATNTADIKAALGQRPLLDLIDFAGGTEAVTAPYEAGKLLIVEYASPQGSVDADQKFTEALAANPDATAYRRIGNYNVLVFDGADVAAATALIDQVKYEKDIQWLGKNPFRISSEHSEVLTTAQMFLSTFLIVILGIGLAVGGGVIAGYIFFYIRDQKQASMPTFSDAGGMTRLNLDGFTPEIPVDRLLKD